MSVRAISIPVAGLLAGGLLATTAPASAAPMCFGKPATIVGTDGADNLQGTDGADVVVLRGGPDVVATGGGQDLVCGGGGDDQIRLGIGADKADGGGGDDVVLAARGNDLLRGGDDSDSLSGGDGDDFALGQAGPDFLAGNAGDDRLVGGPGGETFLGDGGDDTVIGGPGNFDLMSYFRSDVGVTVDLAITGPQATGQGLDTLRTVEGLEGSVFDDRLFGNALDTPAGNGLFGLAGEDLLDGRQKVDFAAADEGDDAVYGRAGPDQLFGGNGEEVAGDFGSGGPGFDLCDEFESDDGTCESVLRSAFEATVGGWAAVRARLAAPPGI